MRNPPWLRDELILALDLYLRAGRKVLDGRHRDVIELSHTLNALPLHVFRPDAARFRNPNGVNLKLANFRAIDVPGRGMNRGNRLERDVWDKFAADPSGLARVASAIRAGLTTRDTSVGAAVDVDEETAFPEGAVLYRLHRARERSAKLIAEKKRLALKKTGKLACEACRFDFRARYGEVGEGFIECHHTLPVSEMAKGSKTRLADLALVCANCHRMLHRRRPWLRIGELKEVLAV